MAVNLYLYDAGKNLRGVAVWGIRKLIHDERDFLLTAEILNRYSVRPGEYVGFMCEDGRYRLFKAERAAVHPSAGFTAVTATEAAVAELAASIVPEVRCADSEGNEIKYAADKLAEMVLKGSGFVLGKRTDGRKAAISKYCAKRWRALRDIESACGVRIIPYYKMEDGRITEKVVDIEEKTYQRTGRILQRETDATNIQITYEGCAIARMYGVGANIGTEDPPTSVTFKDIAWRKTDGDPMDKPKGQMYLENPEVIARGVTDEDVFENKNISDPLELLKETRKALLERSRPKVSGTATAFDVAHIPGYKHKSVQMYDILDVPDDAGGTVEGIVIDIQRNYIEKGRTQIVLGEEGSDVTTIDKMVARLMNETTSLRGSSSAAATRYIENKHLIQLNANRIVMNAEEILAQAERIRLQAQKTDELTGRVTSAELELHGDGTSARAGLIARVNDNEAAVRLHATEIGTLAEIKADKVDLGKYATVERLEAELAEFALSLGDSMVLRTLNVTGSTSTNTLYASGLATFTSMRFDGKNIKRSSKKVISGGSCSFESTKKTVVDAYDNPIGYVYVPTKVTFNPSGEETIKYLAEE